MEIFSTGPLSNSHPNIEILLKFHSHTQTQIWASKKNLLFPSCETDHQRKGKYWINSALFVFGHPAKKLNNFLKFFEQCPHIYNHHDKFDRSNRFEYWKYFDFLLFWLNGLPQTRLSKLHKSPTVQLHGTNDSIYDDDKWTEVYTDSLARINGQHLNFCHF